MKMSKYIPVKAQLREFNQQQIRRAYFTKKNKANIDKAKELFGSPDTMEEGIQLLKDTGVSAKHAAELLLDWHIAEVAKADALDEKEKGTE